MHTHGDAIINFMMEKYFQKHLYEYYSQFPLHFVDFSANPSNQRYFCKESFLYVYYILDVFCFLRFISFRKYCKYFIYQLHLKVLRLHLGCKKKAVVFRWTNSNLDEATLNILLVSNFSNYMWAATTTIPVTVLVPINYFSDCFESKVKSQISQKSKVSIILIIWLTESFL